MELEQIIKEIEQVESRIKSALDLTRLEEIRIEILGKNGVLTGVMRSLGSLEPEKRKEVGAALNGLKEKVSTLLDDKKAELEMIELNQKLIAEKCDLSLPTKFYINGTLHPITRAINEISEIFYSMGFSVEEGPSIEDDFHNFDALNIPDSHPARQMHDTFYMKDSDLLLRTHTSTVQIRKMTEEPGPTKIIVPGRVYRFDYDATHTPMFHQMEGLYIDHNVTFAQLKWCIENFLKMFFEKDSVPVRFRPSYFPFTEPSAEVDIGCLRTKGDLIIGEGEDWLEILGCGMVHRNVLLNCKIDPDKYSGFAFGMGIERLAMLKYGASDLRQFFECDIRWLKHYGSSFFNAPSIAGGLSE